MGDHSLRDDEPAAQAAEPVEPARDVAKIIEVKVVVATLMSLFASVMVAVLTTVADSPVILSGWPPWLQLIVLAAVPPILTFLGGWAKASNRVP